MFIDLDRMGGTLSAKADACIVGGGAAGISIAKTLLDAGWTICLLEAGGLAFEKQQQNHLEGESVGEPVRIAEGRYRQLGGATAYWTGRCAELDPIDFESRGWIEDSGWPIEYAELEPYYRRAEAMCGFGEAWTNGAARLTKLRGVGNWDAGVDPFLWRFAPTRRNAYQNWATRFRATLERSGRAQVMLHACLTAIEQAPGRTAIDALVARSLHGASVRVEAKHYILCCGGIENARLLLNAVRCSEGSLRGIEDSVGRWFMQHPRAHVADIVAPGREAQLQHLFNRFTVRNGTEYETGFALSNALQRQEHLLNASAVLRYAPPAHSLRGAISDWRRNRSWRGIEFIPGRPRLDTSVALARDALRWAAGRHPILQSPRIQLITDLEQLPNRASRVVLSDQPDAFGLHRARLDWRIAPLERHTSARLVKSVSQWMSTYGLGTVEPVTGLDEHGGLTPTHMLESYHHIGGTRMSANRDHGVVDRDCKLHGVDNLHVCGASVMPTGGHANPTFTITALALRLAEHLDLSLRRSANWRSAAAP